MEKIALGPNTVCECPKCEGLWVDTASLARICAEREQQAATLGLVQPPQPATGAIDPVRYVPCPVCHQLMNRVNFAHCSNVIVDVCKAHGTWFDCNELRRVVEFIQSGGLESARQRELAELEARRREIAAMQPHDEWHTGTSETGSAGERHRGISFLADALSSVLDGF